MSYYQKNQGQPSLDSLSDDSLLRLKTLTEERLVPFSGATVWRKCKEGSFPKPVKISEQITAWRLGDIRAWGQDPAGYRVSKLGAKK
jgi:predicted DNA-binding transcriptional regulator AlpA